MYPELWTFASGAVRSYTVMLCLTFIAGTAVAYWHAGTEGLDRGRGFLLAPLVLATALLGARLKRLAL